MKTKKVISASRRVELLEFYPDYIRQKIEEIGIDNIHTLVIWTKNPQNILIHKGLRVILKKLDQIYLLLTITGLGGTILEPKVPQPEKILNQLPHIIDFLDSPLRIAVRYDPLVDAYLEDKSHLTNMDLKLFESVLEEISDLGIRRVITSYITLYSKVIKRLDRQGIKIIDHNLEEIVDLIKNKMMPEVREYDMELSTCVLPHITKTGCIDGRLLSILHPRKEPCSLTKDKSQRESCHCTKSFDIGQWFSCPYGCLYCYGNPQITCPPSADRGRRFLGPLYC